MEHHNESENVHDGTGNIIIKVRMTRLKMEYNESNESKIDMTLRGNIIMKVRLT